MRGKSCKTCGSVKPLSEFYAHDRMADGYLSFCKECVKARVKKHRRDHDSVREYDRARYQNDPTRKRRTAERAKKWNEKHPDRYKAHYAVSNAIRDKRMQRMPCEVCGNPKSHAHHEDYSKPLDVKWLCAVHHQRHHHR